MGAWPDQITLPDQLPLAMLTPAAQHDTAETLITDARLAARSA